MSSRLAFPMLRTQSMPTISAEERSATDSPARGKEMRATLLQKLRPHPFIHEWEFWHDRQDRKPKGSSGGAVQEARYEDRLVKLSAISDIRDFWQVFNNFDVGSLPLRDSVHLFHKGITPIWEDPRNTKGGAWTFRVPKDKAPQFWQEICLMAVGDHLQDAVKTDRSTFLDDICGVSLSVRFTSNLITIWNRDADHKEGIQKILDTVLEMLSEELVPKDSSYYYKRHSEHAGFRAPEETATAISDGANGVDGAA